MKRILIVDDAIDLGRLLQDAMKTVHPGVPISVVPSAEEALLESTRFTIDVLVTDLRLPGMSGLDLIRKIRVRQPNVKVILITGLRPEDRLYRQKDEVSVDFFLRKPFLMPDFLNAVDQLLGDVNSPEKVVVRAPEPAVQPPLEKPVEPADQSAAQSAVLKELAEVMPGEPVEPPPPVLKAPGQFTFAAESPAAEPVETGLSGVLSRLRASLGALMTLFLDDRGKPVAQAGALPDLQVENLLAPPLLASLSAGAKISYLLGQAETQSVQAYRGGKIELVVAPVGQYVLLIALPAGRTVLRLALAFEEALNAQTDLSAALEAMGLRVHTSVETGAPEVILAEMATAEKTGVTKVLGVEASPLARDPGLEKFEELFKKKKTGELRLQDPDSFWDMANAGGNELSQPGVLTFEQAQKLGLFPSDKE